MAIYHRKLLPEPYYNQTADCFDCRTTCPYDCDYYWPPQPSSTNDDHNATTHISPYLIVIVTVIGSAILFISYYLIMIRYCARFRQPPSATQVNQDFLNEPHQPEIDHPIWYITTIGLQPAVINSIAVVKFKKGDSLIDVTDCSVCLSEFEDDESLRLLPKCNHAFHIPCIDAWLRSHTNCPVCRAAILSNNANSILQSNINQERNQNSQMVNTENGGELGFNGVQESEIRENDRETGNGVDVEDGSKESQDLKTETETVITLRRSFSVDSSADIILTESNSSNSTIELQGLNDTRDSRTRRMVRSFSCSGRSIV